MRISGLASGMDTETMVKDLMKAKRLPLDKIMQKKQYTEWQRDDYRAVNKSLYDFRNLTNDSMMKQSTFIKKTVTASAPDDVSIKNINSVIDFSGKIYVDKLAEAATVQSSGKVLNSEADLTKKLSELSLTPTPGDFIIKSIKSDGSMDAGYTVKIDANSTMQSVIDDINKNSGVNAYYDNYTGKLAFTAKNSGDVKDPSLLDTEDVLNEIEFLGNANNYAFLKVDANNIIAAGNNRGTVGENAKFTYNGLVTERQSNTFKINGYEITLKQANKKDITFSSSVDVDSILESVTKFVDEYNKLIADLNGQIRETKYKDYQPLTDTEKESLSEDQIKKWEEKAKSGTLKNDSIISGVLNKMRNALSSAVTGDSGSQSLNNIGIKTTSNYLDYGKLTIDETKLRAAISEDPNQVYELFASDGKTDSEKGLARRITSALDDARKSIITKAGSESSAVNNKFTLGRLLDNYDSQITRFEDRLSQVEDRYWKQFTAMETAIQKANSQSTYLSGMFSTGA